MTRYVDGHPFPDDDSRTDAELRGAIARSEQEERRKRVARKHERRLAERRQIPPHRRALSYSDRPRRCHWRRRGTRHADWQQEKINNFQQLRILRMAVGKKTGGRQKGSSEP